MPFLHIKRSQQTTAKARSVQSVRFELTHPKIVRPERTALDLSAKIASVTSKILNVYNLLKALAPPNLRQSDLFVICVVVLYK